MDYIDLQRGIYMKKALSKFKVANNSNWIMIVLFVGFFIPYINGFNEAIFSFLKIVDIVIFLLLFQERAL